MPKIVPPFTTAEKKEIMRMASQGMRNEDIAEIKGVSESTLKRRCRKELVKGRIKGRDVITNTAFRMAASGTMPAMTIFWLKTQCYWQERQHINISTEPESTEKLPDLPNDPIAASREYQKIMGGKK